MAIRKNWFVQLREDDQFASKLGYAIMTTADRQAWYDQHSDTWHAYGSVDDIADYIATGKSSLAPTMDTVVLKPGRRYLTIQSRCRYTPKGIAHLRGMARLLDPSTGVEFYSLQENFARAS